MESTVDAKQALQETAVPAQVEPLPVEDAHPQRISLWRLGWIWFMMGLQSFGGGTATLFLIRRAAVDQYKWVSPEDFTRDWALVQAAPGINLLCITILIGNRVAGFVGGLVALIGLMFPSVALTIVMTALYADLRDLPVVQAALRGVVPATVGLGLVLSVRMVMPILAEGRRQGGWILPVYIVIILGSIAAILFWEAPVILILCGAGVIGGLSQWLYSSKSKAGQP